VPSKKKFREKLLKSIAEQQMVRVERKPRFADRLDGFVLAVGKRWALMARTSEGGYFDGSVAFRMKDVGRLTVDQSFQPTFARTQPEWPPSAVTTFELDTISELLKGLADVDTLVGIEKDEERSAIWIGRLDEVDVKTVWLHEVRPNASWHDVPRGYKLKAITTVSVGSRYLTALAAVSGTEPSAAAE
jgi:hypothetical protein